jgi:hypothetical protein
MLAASDPSALSMLATDGDLFAYSSDRKGEHRRADLKKIRGVSMPTTSPFYQLFAGGRITEVGCWGV